MLGPAGVLTIGTGVLGLGDFDLSDLGGLQDGTYTLIETDQVISGSLNGGDTIGTLGGADLELVISGDGTDLQLVVSGLGGGQGPVDSFVISAVGSSQTVGTPLTGIPITALDVASNTATGFTGTVTFGGSGGFSGSSASFVAGVLSGVSVTPTAAGEDLTLTVDDGSGHTGSTTITKIRTLYEEWSGEQGFDLDSNGDGVGNGMAFLLGAADPNVDARGLLPAVSQSGGNLVMTFDCLANADRGGALLNLQHDADLSAPWTSVPVPGVVGDSTDGDVSFSATANGSMIRIVATIDGTAAADGRLFGRLEASTP